MSSRATLAHLLWVLAAFISFAIALAAVFATRCPGFTAGVCVMRSESHASACSFLTFSSAAVGQGEGEPAPSLQRREETAFSWWGREGFCLFFSRSQRRCKAVRQRTTTFFWHSPLVGKASELMRTCSFRCEIVEQCRSCRGRKHLAWNISLMRLRDSVYSCTSEHSNWLKRLKVVLWGVFFFFFHLINLFVFFPCRCVFLAIFLKGKKYKVYLHNTSIFFLSLLQ